MASETKSKDSTTSSANADNKEKKAKGMTDEVAFVVCVLGIYVSYMLFGLLQEELTRSTFGPDKKKFKNTAFLVFVQCVGNCLCGVLAVKWFTKKPETAPFTDYMLISATYVGAMWASNYSIQFVSFPFMVLAKSCKPIPVLLMSVIAFGKKQTFLKYVCVFLVTIGITVFMSDEIYNSKSNVETSIFGISLLGLSLAMDGVTGPFQDRLVSKYRPSSPAMMLNTNLWASIYLGVGLLFTPAGVDGVTFLIEHPAVIPHVILYAISSAIGQNFIYYTIQRFGSLACSLITTTRKFFTILISVMIFGPMLTPVQWVGVIIVFIGLGVDIYSSKSKKKEE